jgi:hypothetical protein
MVTIYGLFYSAKATRGVLPLHSVPAVDGVAHLLNSVGWKHHGVFCAGKHGNQINAIKHYLLASDQCTHLFVGLFPATSHGFTFFLGRYNSPFPKSRSENSPSKAKFKLLILGTGR